MPYPQMSYSTLMCFYYKFVYLYYGGHGSVLNSVGHLLWLNCSIYVRMLSIQALSASQECICSTFFPTQSLPE